jgi:hypothetical protein
MEHVGSASRFTFDVASRIFWVMIKCAILWLTVVPSLLAVEVPLKVSLLESNVLWVQAGQVTADFSTQLRAAQPTNKISGTVLDLRFAEGDSAAGADYFLGKTAPLVILVNGQTRGAAAGLAAQLRSAGRGIVIGSTNAPENLQPDFKVAVSADDEKKFQANPFAAAPGASHFLAATNDLLPFVDHMSEAQLVSKRIKDGEDDGLVPAPRVEPPSVIRDPALARAVDLLKALAVLNQPRG